MRCTRNYPDSHGYHSDHTWWRPIPCSSNPRWKWTRITRNNSAASLLVVSARLNHSIQLFGHNFLPIKVLDVSLCKLGVLQLVSDYCLTYDLLSSRPRGAHKPVWAKRWLLISRPGCRRRRLQQQVRVHRTFHTRTLSVSTRRVAVQQLINTPVWLVRSEREISVWVQPPRALIISVRMHSSGRSAPRTGRRWPRLLTATNCLGKVDQAVTGFARRCLLNANGGCCLWRRQSRHTWTQTIRSLGHVGLMTGWWTRAGGVRRGTRTVTGWFTDGRWWGSRCISQGRQWTGLTASPTGWRHHTGTTGIIDDHHHRRRQSLHLVRRFCYTQNNHTHHLSPISELSMLTFSDNWYAILNAEHNLIDIWLYFDTRTSVRSVSTSSKLTEMMGDAHCITCDVRLKQTGDATVSRRMTSVCSSLHHVHYTSQRYVGDMSSCCKNWYSLPVYKTWRL